MNNNITIIHKEGKRLYKNSYGYIHCEHTNMALIEVITNWGNKSFVCPSCGEVVRKELTPTSL